MAVYCFPVGDVCRELRHQAKVPSILTESWQQTFWCGRKLVIDIPAQYFPAQSSVSVYFSVITDNSVHYEDLSHSSTTFCSCTC